MAAFPVLAESWDRLRQVGSGLTVEELRSPTPCADWNVAQVLLHAAGDQRAWGAAVGTSPSPTYDPFAPPPQLDGTVEELLEPAIAAASGAWGGVAATDPSVPTPLPPFPTMAADLAAAACGLDAAIHAWDVAVATGRPSPLTGALAEQLQTAADVVVESLRGYVYASALPDARTQDPVDVLLRHLGRDPAWTP